MIFVWSDRQKRLTKEKVHWLHNHSSQHLPVILFSLSLDNTMVNSSNNIWRDFWTLIHEWFYATCVHLYLIHTILVFRNNDNNNQGKFDWFPFKSSDENFNNWWLINKNNVNVELRFANTKIRKRVRIIADFTDIQIAKSSFLILMSYSSFDSIFWKSVIKNNIRPLF
jgi:hypothetical protein